MANRAIHISWMIRRHLDEVLPIERRSFRVPWSRLEFMDRLGDRKTVGLVAEGYVPDKYGRFVRGPVVGYCLYRLYPERVQLQNLAVAPGRRRQGIGSAILRTIREKLTRNRSAIELLIAERNLAGQMFFRQEGFRAILPIQRWHFSDGQDAYRMRWSLPVEAPKNRIGHLLRAHP